MHTLLYKGALLAANDTTYCNVEISEQRDRRKTWKLSSVADAVLCGVVMGCGCDGNVTIAMGQ